jgi:hypothetical protein
MTHRIPTERSFGLSVGVVFLGLATVLWWRGNTSVAPGLFAVGAFLVAGALIAPSVLRVPNRLWWRFAQVLGWVNARVLLTLFFAVVLTPLGLAMRALGRNPLRAARAETNWSAYAARRRDPKHYDHSF